MMNERLAISLRLSLIATAIAVAVFELFWGVTTQIKFIRAVSPFQIDPYDAVGSFGFQIAFVLVAWTILRALAGAAPSKAKAVLIMRGNTIALAAVCATLGGDIIAEARHPSWGSLWGTFLIAALGVTVVVTIPAVIATLRLRGAIRENRAPATRTFFQATLDDLMAIDQKVAAMTRGRISFARVIRMLRSTPYTFYVVTALVVGVAFTFVTFVGESRNEGLPSSFAAGLLFASLFIGVETVVFLACIMLFGGFLGLRPPLIRSEPH